MYFRQVKLYSFFLVFCFVLQFNSLFAVAIEGNSIEGKLLSVDYFFCMDGGGSKTALQILDKQGRPLLLTKNKEQSYLIQGDCSNIVVVGKDGVCKVFDSLLSGLKVGEQQLPVEGIISRSLFFGGFAGADRPSSRNPMLEVIKSRGFLPDNINIYTDAGLALELVGQSGAILISGTGSICFIKEGEEVKRIGGLGYRIGDEGSGYQMGLSAIKAAIEEEFHYGQETSLTHLVKEHFRVNHAIDLIAPVNGNKESPGKIASFAPFVFQEAWKGDNVAYRIVENAANELGELLSHAVNQTDLKHCLTYLIGGLFQNKNANTFIQMICQSPEMQKLSKGARPLLVNLSENMVPSLVIQEKLKRLKGKSFDKLASLPVVDDVMREDYSVLYNEEFFASRPSSNSKSDISQTFYQDRLAGLKKIQQLDYVVLERVKEFIERDYLKVVSRLLKKVKSGGRVVFVGRGSSGRLCVDLAAKWNEYWQESGCTSSYQNSIQAVLSGGAQAYMLPKEQFEDSEKLGFEALADLELTPKDVVVIISATGKPKFHVGAAKAAAEAKASCYYFYHAAEPTKEVKELSKGYHTELLALDVGPQTIIGSNRLQSASLSELTWGLVLNEMLYQLVGHSDSIDRSRALAQIETLSETWDHVATCLPDIKKMVDMQIEVFSDKDANFWKAFDKTYHGYVTFLAAEDCLRDIMVDITETSPAFSANPPRSMGEKGKKKAEYRAYMLGDYPNSLCWEKMMARSIKPSEQKNVSDFLLSMKGQGFGDFFGRTISKKNMLIGTLSSSLETKKALELCLELIKVKDRGLKTGIIVLEEEGFPFDPSIQGYLNQNDVYIHIHKVPSDRLHLMRTLALKQVLNLISNGAMIGMNKVYGNVMIDIASSQEEMIDRTIRIVQTIYSDYHPEEKPFEYELLYHLVTRSNKYKQLVETQLGKHIPSPAKMVLTMLETDCDVEQAVAKLKMNNENIQLIMNQI